MEAIGLIRTSDVTVA